jgi:hypothetical protein
MNYPRSDQLGGVTFVSAQSGWSLTVAANEGHVLDLQAKADVSDEELEVIIARLTALLGERVLGAAIVEDGVLRVHVATTSRVTALAAVRAGLGALGCNDSFVGYGSTATRDRTDGARGAESSPSR